MTWIQARIVVQATLGRTLVYPLTATTFNEEQSKLLQKTFLQAVLRKIGFVRTTPELIATAPTKLGGVGVLSFDVQQLV
jgi:hypothetical protein